MIPRQILFDFVACEQQMHMWPAFATRVIPIFYLVSVAEQTGLSLTWLSDLYKIRHCLDANERFSRGDAHLCGKGTTMAQTSLRTRAVWSAPLLFVYWSAQYLNLHLAFFNILASLCSWAGWFLAWRSRKPRILVFSRQSPYIVLFWNNGTNQSYFTHGGIFSVKSGSDFLHCFFRM